MTESYDTLKTGSDSISFNSCNKNKKCFQINKRKYNNYNLTIEDKRIFKCPVDNCGKLFREKGNLRTHIRVHVIKR